MIKIFSVYVDESNIGEAEGFLDDKGNVLDYWSCNDATWRDEYFNPVFKKLGIEILDDFSAVAKKKLKAHIKKNSS